MSVFFRLVPAVSDFQDSLVVPVPNRSNEPEPKLDLDPHETDSLFEAQDSKPVRLNLMNDPPRIRFPPNKHRQFSPYITLCVTTFSLAFCCFLVHGAVTRQPTHLLPFFFLQVFDLIICLLNILGFMSSASDFHLMIHTKDGPFYINSTGFTFFLLFISCTILAFKAYCLGMVWDCYKYLMISNRRGGATADDWSSDRYGFLPTIWSLLGVGRRAGSYNRNTFPRTDTGSTGDSNLPPPPPISAIYDQTNDLPKYEDALKIPANAYAPPPYFCPADTNKSSSISIPQSTVTTSQAPGASNTPAGSTASSTTTLTTSTTTSVIPSPAPGVINRSDQVSC